MCGIYGSTKIYSENIIEKKMDQIKFRGPDYTSYKFYDNQVIFGHNRLSIIDLNPRSNQPFEYHHLSIVFNGQIYNYKELKNELIKDNFIFKTESDTEVLIALYLKYGKECTNKLNGMFAFVIYDKKNNIFFGARDRLGQKPFYYTLVNNSFEFSSQLSSIILDNKFSVNKESVRQYLICNYIHEPKTIYNNIYKLEAGHSFIYDLSSKSFVKEKYWDLDYSINNQVFNYDYYKKELEKYIRDSVKMRMLSDVPLGVFLSGGIDSSLIAYMAQDLSTDKIKTFSIKFNEQKFDESIYAKKIASLIDSDHTTINCNESEGIDLIESMPMYYDEPFADSSAIPTMLLSKHTRKDVTVAISGDGGDEFFLGYNRYDFMNKYQMIYNLPFSLRKTLAFFLNRMPINKVSLFGNVLKLKNKSDFYKKFMGLLNDSWMSDKSNVNWINYDEIFNSDKNYIEQISDFDIKTYLNGDINTKVDRGSMAFSLETRSPLMDYRIVELSRKIPTQLKYKKQNKKIILKDILYKYLPKENFQRPKSGFKIPFEYWFRNDLKEFVLDTLSENNLKDIPYIDVSKTLDYIEEHMSSRHNRYDVLWKLIVLINWKKMYNESF